MNLLLIFLIGLFAYAATTADRAAERPRAVTLLAICLVVAVGYTARRFI